MLNYQSEEDNIASFHKVSFVEYERAFKEVYDSHSSFAESAGIKHIDPEVIAEAYDAISLPSGSDFPIYDIGSGGRGFSLTPGRPITILTGLKCRIDPGWCLMVLPNDEFGNKYHVRLNNTMTIINSSYYHNNKNEGHIILHITREFIDYGPGNSASPWIEPNTPFFRGVFVPCGSAYC